MTAPFKLPKDTSKAAQQRNLKKIEDVLNAILRGSAEGLALTDLTDVDVAEGTDGYVLTLTGGRWSAQVLPDPPASAVVIGTGDPVGEPATTLVFISPGSNRIYFRANTTVGPGAAWQYVTKTADYTEP